VPQLPAIEEAAGRLFRGVVALPDDPATGDVPWFGRVQAAGLLWVAVDARDAPVAFAALEVLGAGLHLEEVDVHPDHARQGLGARLVEAACAFAREQGYPEITLTTFRDVPWNAPYYRRLGFQEVPEADWSPALRARVAEEAARGIGPAGRAVMRRPVA